MYVPSRFLLNKLMTQLIDHAVAGPFSGVLDGIFMGLYIAPTPGLTPQSTMNNITEATYTGYARQAVVWHAPYIDPANAESIQAASLIWQPTDGVTPNQITGIFVADANAAGNLLLSSRLPGTGIPLGDATMAFGAALLFQLSYTGDYGDVQIIQ